MISQFEILKGSPQENSSMSFQPLSTQEEVVEKVLAMAWQLSIVMQTESYFAGATGGQILRYDCLDSEVAVLLEIHLAPVLCTMKSISAKVGLSYPSDVSNFMEPEFEPPQSYFEADARAVLTLRALQQVLEFYKKFNIEMLDSLV